MHIGTSCTQPCAKRYGRMPCAASARAVSSLKLWPQNPATLFTHKLQPLSAYKKLEGLMNRLAQHQEAKGQIFLDAASKADLTAQWKSMASDLSDPTAGACVAVCLG